MKKIIYSLVIMIAAGSLFTSCVTNTEPQGIKDLREAKADYLASLSKLREADAELVKAKAAYQDAETAYKNAETALKQALVKAAEIRNSKADAEAKAYIDSIVAQAKITAVNQEKILAETEYALQKALRDIAVKSQNLTYAEFIAVQNYAAKYDAYIQALNAVRVAERNSYDKATDREEFILDQQEKSAEALATIAKYEDLIQNLPDSGQSVADTLAFFEKLKKDSIELKYKVANLQKEWNLYEQTEVDPQIKGFAEELGQWIAQNVALPAPFMMHYKAELPDNDQVIELVEKYVDLYAPAFDIDDNEGSLLANFNSTPDARRGIKALTKVIDGISRERVIDSTSFAYDTTGMSAAIDTLKKKYQKVYTDLDKGIGAYKGIADAQAKAKTAKEAKEAAQKKFEADTANLLGSIRAFVKLWNEVAAEGGGELVSRRNLNDSLDIFNALKDIMTYRTAVFGKDTTFAYYESDKQGDTVKVFVPFTELEFSGIRLNKNGKVLYSGSADEDGACVWNEINAFATILDAAFGTEEFFAGLMDVSEEDGVTTTTISAFEFEDLRYPAAGRFKPMFFGKAFVNEVGKLADEKLVDGKSVAYKSEAVAKAAEDYTKAEADIKTAKEDYYKKVYCEYWGIDYENLKDASYFDAENVKFSDDADSLRLKDFTYATYTDATDITKFSVNSDKPYSSKDSTFNLKGYIKNNPTTQFKIVWEEFKLKQGPDVQNVPFENFLIAELLCAEQIKASFSTGSEGVSAALAALEDILKDITAEFDAAVEKQAADSKPFYTFIEGLVGKDCLDHIFAALDSALTEYAQYAPARAEGENKWVDLANAIAAKEITAKGALILYFEKFMCGEFDFNGGIFDAIEDVAESKIYRTAYIALQVADAVPGEQFRTLLSDVITAFVNSAEVNVVAWNKLLAEAAGINTDNIIEKILFGTERMMFNLDLFGTEENVQNSANDAKVSAILMNLVPVLVPYILNDFGGELGALEEKYLSGWAEKWAEFDIKAVELEAEKAALKTAEAIYRDYVAGIKDLIDVYDEYTTAITQAKDDYAKACDHLAKIEAGVDWYTIFSESAADALEAAKVKLEAAEAELAIAEAAYKQVLANHGLTE